MHQGKRFHIRALVYRCVTVIDGVFMEQFLVKASMTTGKLLDPDDMPKWLGTLWPINKYGPSFLTAINDDDCAVMRWGKSLMVVTTDFINSHPIVTELGIGDEETLGRLVVAANLCDLCGTGATPVAMLVGITMHYGSTEKQFKNIMRGVERETRKHGIPVIGGDTKLGRSSTILGVAIGSADSKRNLFLKKGAKSGDQLWSSGELGSCAAAVIGLKEGFGNKQWRNWAKNVLCKPAVPVNRSSALAALEVAHGGTDLSDGLGVGLHNLCSQSGIGVELFAEQIPIAPQVRELAASKGISPWAFAFGSGGDFQFVVTTQARAYRQVRDLGFHPIGRVTRALCLELRCGDRPLRQIPDLGHRDSRGLSFYDEILRLVHEVDHV